MLKLTGSDMHTDNVDFHMVIPQPHPHCLTEGKHQVSGMYDYSPLWKTLKEKGITQYQLIKDFNISTGALNSLRQNRSVTLKTIETLCLLLDCTPNDILKIIKKPM